MRTGTGRNQKEGESAHSPPICQEVRLAASSGTSRHGSSWVLESRQRPKRDQRQKSHVCHIRGSLPASPTALWRLTPVCADTRFVSIGACLAGGPTHPECCFGTKLGMEPDATENLRKGSLPSEAGRAECSYPQEFKRESQADIIKQKKS